MVYFSIIMVDYFWVIIYSCVQVIEESVKHETLRPKWKQLMSNLERGDELVVSKFSNAVRGLRELAALIELCRIKVVRIISIHDKIDTCNELFCRYDTCRSVDDVRGTSRGSGRTAKII